ncbi:MAG: DNA-binding response regulator [Firmicutes bacterium]|nr:DNA-binding response regulator [Bacillota bacterium]
MSRIRCIIVEDEIPAAEELEFLITQNEDFVVDAMACNGEEGYEMIMDLNPDVVFLDINMPLQNGVELAKRIHQESEDTEIVFLTACGMHAVEAFELNALDYVLKPVDEQRLDMTLDRIRNKINEAKKQADLPELMSKMMDRLEKKQSSYKKLPGELNGKIIFIDLKDIYFCYIEEEKTYIKTRDKSFMTWDTLCQIEKKTNFFRAHRSYIVNLDNIKEMFAWFNGTYKLVMDDSEKSEIPVSRNNIKKLKELLGI